MAQVRARAEQGYVDQQIELAAAYLSGRGIAQDFAQAAHWYKKAAQAGDPVAQNLVGYFYQKGIGVRLDLDNAARWYQLSASSGYALAKVNLGVLYLQGLGVRQNPQTARSLFEEAVEHGEGLGAAYLGNMEYSGIGGPVNHREAERWFQRGVKLQDGLSAYDLGCLYSAASGHEHDLRRAADLMRMASRKGYVPAMSTLGLLLLQNSDLAETPNEPRKLLETASGAGNWQASMLLGVLARDGRLMAASPAKAFYYFRLAEMQGGDRAQEKVANDLNALVKKLSPKEQRARSDEAQAWTRSHQVTLSYVIQDDKLKQRFPVNALTGSSASSSGE